MLKEIPGIQKTYSEIHQNQEGFRLLKLLC